MKMYTYTHTHAGVYYPLPHPKWYHVPTREEEHHATEISPPCCVHQSKKNITKRLQAQATEFEKLSERNSKHLYIERCQALPGYDCTFFSVKVPSGGRFRKGAAMKQLLGISDKYIVFLDEKTKVGSNGLVPGLSLSLVLVCPVKWILRPAIPTHCTALLPSSNILLSCYPPQTAHLSCYPPQTLLLSCYPPQTPLLSCYPPQTLLLSCYPPQTLLLSCYPPQTPLLSCYPPQIPLVLLPSSNTPLVLLSSSNTPLVLLPSQMTTSPSPLRSWSAATIFRTS